MATRISKATGNFTTAGTWALVDATSYIDSESSTFTATTSLVYSSTFTPSAATYDGVALKVNVVASPAGTITVSLVKNSDNSVAGSQTINISDIANTNTGQSYNRGWYFFKFASGVALDGVTAYKIGVQKSVGGATATLTFYASTSNAIITRMLRTTTTGAPASGDQLHVIGELTGAGTGNSFTVTMDNTATTSFGPTVSGGPPQGITVGIRGTMTFGTAASTNYYLKWKGILGVFDGGTMNVGTNGTPIPSTSTAVLEMDSVANVDTGIEVYHGGTLNVYGTKGFTSSPSNHFSLMTLDRGGYCTTNGTAVTATTGQSQSFTGLSGTIVINAVSYTISSVGSSTSLTLTGSAGVQSSPQRWTHAGTANVVTVGDTTGWAANDTVCIGSTSQTTGDSETAIIQSVDSSTQITLTTSLTKPHNGVSPTQGEVGNLTRNVKIRGIGTNAPSTTTTLQGYVNLAATAVVTLRYAEFYYLGSATANKRGIDVAATTGSFDMQLCSIHDGWITSSDGVNVTTTTGSVTFSKNVTCNINTGHFVCVATSGAHTVTSNLAMLSAAASPLIQIADNGSTVTGNYCVSSFNCGLSMQETNGVITNCSGNNCHACGTTNFQCIASSGIVDTLTCWRGLSNGNGGMNLFNCSSLVFTNGLFFGNGANAGTANIRLIATTHGATACVFDACTLSGDSVFAVASGLNLGTGVSLVLKNCDFSTVTGIRTAHTQDVLISASAAAQIQLENCKLGAATTVSGQSNLTSDGFVSSQRHNQTSGSHKCYLAGGTVTIDTTIYNTASPSARLAPISASVKLPSAAPLYGFTKAVASGATCAASIYVRKSVVGDGAAYNGNQPRLIVRKNVSLGITSDTVLATAAGAAGSWEQLSGTTAAVTDDGVLEFIVDCDGSAGWVNADDFA